MRYCATRSYTKLEFEPCVVQLPNLPGHFGSWRVQFLIGGLPSARHPEKGILLVNKHLVGRLGVAFCTLVGCVLLARTATATQSDGRVGFIYIQSSVSNSSGVPVYLFTIKTSDSHGLTGCAGSGRYATKDKSIYDLLLTAKLAGKQITVVGQDACTVWHDAEDIAWVLVP